MIEVICFAVRTGLLANINTFYISCTEWMHSDKNMFTLAMIVCNTNLLLESVKSWTEHKTS